MQTVTRPAVAALMAFAFFALAAAPLCAALLVCTMPCCHHIPAAGIKGVATCPLSNNGCETTVSANDDAVPTTVARSQRVDGRAIVVEVSPATGDPQRSGSASFEAQVSGSASARPLHVLNSVFRI